MGFIEIMKRQENPDGIEGHNERLALQDEYKKLPFKKKFAGKSRGKSEWMIAEELKMQEEKAAAKRDAIWTEKERLKSRCDDYKEGCTKANCPHCRKNPHRVVKALKKVEKYQEKNNV